jgi:hypothetical protein
MLQPASLPLGSTRRQSGLSDTPVTKYLVHRSTEGLPNSNALIEGQRTGASCFLNEYEEMMPAIFCIPARSPRVVARAELEVMLLVAQAGTKTAGVKVYASY